MNFTALLDLAADSALLRVQRNAGLLVSLESAVDPWRKTDPVWQLSDSVQLRMERLGRECQKYDVDIRQHPFWSLFEFKRIYIEAFEFGRVVHPQQLTLAYSEACLRLGRELHWGKFIVRVRAPEEGTDDYGSPVWASKVHVDREGECVLSFDSVSRQTVREVFQMLTGAVSDKRIDGLGDDPAHPAEYRW